MATLKLNDFQAVIEAIENHNVRNIPNLKPGRATEDLINILGAKVKMLIAYHRAIIHYSVPRFPGWRQDALNKTYHARELLSEACAAAELDPDSLMRPFYNLIREIGLSGKIHGDGDSLNGDFDRYCFNHTHRGRKIDRKETALAFVVYWMINFLKAEEKPIVIEERSDYRLTRNFLNEQQIHHPAAWRNDRSGAMVHYYLNLKRSTRRDHPRKIAAEYSLSTGCNLSNPPFNVITVIRVNDA